jgi:hypothetical protein
VSWLNRIRSKTDSEGYSDYYMNQRHEINKIVVNARNPCSTPFSDLHQYRSCGVTKDDVWDIWEALEKRIAAMEAQL